MSHACFMTNIIHLANVTIHFASPFAKMTRSYIAFADYDVKRGLTKRGFHSE